MLACMYTLSLYTHPDCLRHDTGPGHPERPARLQALLDLFDEPAFKHLPRHEAREATRAQILRAHDPRYIDALEDAIPDGPPVLIDGDTVLSRDSFRAALLAAGAACQAVDDIMSGKTRRAFCAVRPPGHHAGSANAEGFCLFNNVMIGALHAWSAHGAARVAILDFDVHHGNGTEAMTRLHEGIFYASTHEWPLYPGTGDPARNIPGRIVNATLAAGDGSEAFRNAWSKNILPALDDYKPELVMISAGFDAHRDDPLAHINLTEDDFYWITGQIASRGPIVSVLEGGYDLDALRGSARAHLQALLAD